MNQKNPNANSNQGGSNFESGFGGSMFGANGNQSQGGQNFTGGGGAPGGGEFGSGFGGTNAVSQIFKDGGGFNNDDKKKKLIIIGAAVAAVIAVSGAAYYFIFSGEEEGEQPTAEATPAVSAETTPAAESAAVEEDAEDAEAIEDDAEEALAAPAEAGIGGPYTYNEEDGGPVVNATAGANIEVSREGDFSVPYVTGRANESGRYKIPNPPPGKIFWRQSGGSPTELTINPPPSLGLNFAAPRQLSAGGQVTWSGSGPVSFYRVEFATDAEFRNIATVITTSQESASVKEISAGNYFVRLGGFNKAAGKWEWTSKSSVTVQ